MATLKEKDDLANRRFGRLVALNVVPKFSANGGRTWLCACDCGATHEVARALLTSGKTRSCGCLARELTISRLTRHGKSKSSEWAAWHSLRDRSAWHSLRDRCNNPRNGGYADYGGRGIRVCDRWDQSFEAFYSDMGPKPGPDYTLDRRNNDGNYEPSNCRWVTRSTQQHNQRINRRNSSGAKGVSPTKEGKYLAQLMVEGKIVLNKSFDTFEEAVAARKSAEHLHLQKEKGLDIITIAMSRRFAAQKLKVEVVDTTVKSGLPIFAPTWPIVMGHKRWSLEQAGEPVPDSMLRNDPVNDEQYTEIYHQLMRESWNVNREQWLAFMQQTHPLALACYCPAGQFCHRHLLKRILEKLCEMQGIPFRFYGELT